METTARAAESEKSMPSEICKASHTLSQKHNLYSRQYTIGSAFIGI